MNTHRTSWLLRLYVLFALLAPLAACGRVEQARQPLPQADTTPTSVALTAETPTVVAVQTAQPTEVAAVTATAVVPFDFASVPACTFDPNAQAAEAPVRTVDSFTFSEPRIAYTPVISPGDWFQLGGWLTNTHALLYSHLGSTQAEIGTVDTNTGAMQVYTSIEGSLGRPTWVPEESGLAYVGGKGNDSILQLVHGPGQPPVVLGRDVQQLVWSADRQAVLIRDTQSQQQFHIRSLSTTQQPPITQGLRRVGQTQDWELPPTIDAVLHATAPGDEGFDRFQIAWGTRQEILALHSRKGLFLANLAQNIVCNIDLGSGNDTHTWPRGLQWSPDGRFLSVRTTPNFDPPYPGAFLVIDTITGEQKNIAVSAGSVEDIAWSPDSRFILVSSELDPTDGIVTYGISLIDVVRGQFRRIRDQPPYVTSLGDYNGASLTWSRDGISFAFVSFFTVNEERKLRIFVTDIQS